MYDVAPALRPLGTDFGNGELDARWFQLDCRYDEFLEGKRAALAEDYAKYVHRCRLSPEVERAAVEAIGRRLSIEYPQLFQIQAGDLRRAGSTIATLDELALRVQEDICVVRVEDGRDWLAYLHVCSPSHWRPGEKIGKPFFDVHTVIPGIEKVNRAAPSLVDAMVNKGPFVRFVWGIESDARPNHHPDPPPGQDPERWDGRDFSAGVFWVRAERQVIWGLPEVGAALFTIKVCHTPGEDILRDPARRRTLLSALESMSPASREYKGLANSWPALMRLIQPAAAGDVGHEKRD